MQQLLPIKNQNQCSSYAGGLFGLLNYELREFAELFRVLQSCITILLWLGLITFSISPILCEPLQNIKGPFVTLKYYHSLFLSLCERNLCHSLKNASSHHSSVERSNSARSCIILVRDSSCLLNGKTLKAAGLFISCSFNDIFKFKKQATRYVFIKIDLVLLRSSFYFTGRRLPLSQLSLGKDFAAK